MGSASGIVTKLRSLWDGLGRPQRIALGAVAAGALVFAFIMLQAGGEPPYVTAFTNLDPKDANAVVEQLKADAIPYQLSADGGTIKVPPAMAADAKLKLAAKGLPQGGAVGFELFDKTSFGVTDFVQHLNYQRALEGELARTIGTFGPVEGARVHIVVPKQELFVSQQKPATASVVLRLRPGRTLDEASLRGISHMVARSVQGLDPKNITILDAAGRTLYDGGARESGVALSSTQLDLQKKVEKDVEAQVQTLLDQVAGPNRSAVRVRAEMDFSQREQVAESFQPGGQNNQGVPRSTARVEESFSGAGPADLPPGTATNVPGAQRALGTQGGNSTYQRAETTTNYEVSKTVEKTIKSPGEMRRLFVSVVLDAALLPGDGDATAVDQQERAMRNAIAAAAGIDERRGDQLVVTTAKFNGAQPDLAPAAQPVLMDMVKTYGPIVAPLLAALVVLLVVWRMSRSVKPKPARVKVVESSLAALPPGSAAAAYALAAANNAMPALDTDDNTERLLSPGMPAPEISEEARKRREIHERMSNLATANPDAIAEIIHSWMVQDDKVKKK
jgi:flagellar M-ring protein FliF